MSRNKKIINILMASILFITFNFLFILNGCSTSNSSNTVVEESQSDISGEEDASSANAGETSVSEDSAEETDISKNENDEDANDTSPEEDPNSLKNIYQRFNESGKPSILVFSYYGGCCASTKAFFDDYNGTAKKILEDYKSKFNTLFINTGILDKNNMDTAIKIASQNQVLYFPSILILDKTGKAFKVIEGLFDETETRKVLDGMLND